MWGWTGWIIAGVLGLACWPVAAHLRRLRRRKRLLDQPLSLRDQAILQGNVPLYRRLPEGLRRSLHGLIQVFLAEKRFIGCGGLEVTDEMRLTIAAQACMLLLNRPGRFFPKLRTIYLYPSAFVVRHARSDGLIETEDREVLAGESWHRGPVVLAWDEVRRTAADPRDGHNVVLHELAHQLDQEDGVVDGAPVLENRSSYRSWARVLGAEYAALRAADRARRPTVLDDYGATDPAEFFAVATEAFFEKPREMAGRHPELYEQLQAFYHLDPAAWNP